MERYRILLAFVLSFLVLVGYQYLFPPPPPPPGQEQPTPEKAPPAPEAPPLPPAATAPPPVLTTPSDPGRPAREIVVDTDRFRAVFTEAGGQLRSLRLKEYKASLAPEAPDQELVTTEAAADLPLAFSWGGEPGPTGVPLLVADRTELPLSASQPEGRIVMSGQLPGGLPVTRILSFRNDEYRIDLTVEIGNPGVEPVHGAPVLALFGRPVSGAQSSYIFNGPAVYLDQSLHEVATKDLAEGAQELTGSVSWAGYQDHYFLTAMMPASPAGHTARLRLTGQDLTTILLAGPADTLAAQASKRYDYTLFFGPKKLDLLKTVGHDLERVVNFGWFDVLARPTLYLLNWLYGVVHNYGIAIILVTVLIKLVFWPISQKGMESMKNMQKIQPKMAKLREKYKSDPERLNREMMTLYKTYKVNPVGGCLPMIIQIPVFFALYKVLLQAIELRHAPFWLWINDLSAPDRLPIGVDIPWLGGIPVLTLLMGASMFLQQRMTPTSGDPTQAKIMLFLPVIFTFMFVNFASGLVLYWFVNNLLAIGQQYLINRKMA
ncbi:MAG: membrane protein insertase YidC [Thermodesulfobacteriota bacterium]